MIHEGLRQAVQDDARRAGERDRALLEARRARIAGRPHAGPAALASRLAQILFRRAAPPSWAGNPGIEAATPEARAGPTISPQAR
jgi:hypothetical protein